MTDTSSNTALSPVLLSAFTTHRREATRPIAYRTDGFDEKFDDDVLFYDIFRRADGMVTLLGPPLFNLAQFIRPDSIRAMPSRQPCPFRVRRLDRQVQLIVNVPETCKALEISLDGASVEVEIRPGKAALFAGRRVLLTQSKNNELTWIRDWATFAQRFHGADAVLLYDNASDRYGTEEVEDELRRIDGIKAIQVLSWPFKFGPQGLDATRFWDSDFCQMGAWEHARWRFLADARSVQAGDVDELVLSQRGQSVFAAAENDRFGVVRYRGRWVVATDRTPPVNAGTLLRHRDYDTVMRERIARRFGLFPYDTMASAPKWTVVPKRCPPWAQWAVHRITGWLAAHRITREFSHRHFREIGSNWKYARLTRDSYDPELHEIDPVLVAHLRGEAGT
ncbi:hypothetical protein [Mycoplana ramosa]|uniref:Uncharacterized protein n=1 Tax=Mycoplana ramosa TaxID=40837 RepID=A0ABW3Z1H7_MYCRA